VETLLSIAVDLGFLDKAEVASAQRQAHELRWQLKKLIDQVAPSR